MFDESSHRSSASAEARAEDGVEHLASSPAPCELEDFAGAAGGAAAATHTVPAVYGATAVEKRWPSVSAGVCLSRRLELPPAAAEAARAGSSAAALAGDPVAGAALEASAEIGAAAAEENAVTATRCGGLQASVPSASAAGAEAVRVVATGVATSCDSSRASSPLLTDADGQGNCDADGRRQDGGQASPGKCRTASSAALSASADRAVVALPAAKQATPLGLSRYLLLLLHVLYVFASARVLFGWPNLSNMLFRAGAFAWLCDDKDRSPPAEGSRYLCRAQDSAVQLLFTVGIAVSFCCSLLAGLVMDWRGPRLCAVVGQLLNTTGWVLLGVASETCQTYIPAVLCLALGADAGYLPSITVSNLFPGHERLVVVVLSAAMSASFSIPTLMDISWRQHPESLSFKTICLLYAGLGTGLCGVIALVLFPVRPYVSQEEMDRRAAGGGGGSGGPRKLRQQEDDENVDYPALGGQDDEKGSNGNSPTGRASSSTSAGAWSRGGEEEEAVLGSRGRAAECDGGTRQPPTGEQNGEGKAAAAGVSCRDDGESCTLTVKSGGVGEKGEEGSSEKEKGRELVPLRRQLLSPYFLCFFVYWPLNALFYNFYLTSAENMFSREVNDLLGILGPLSMIPSVLLGKLADAFGVMSLVLFICCSAVGMYFFALLPATWAYYVSAVFSCLYVSNFSGQMYAYMQDTFLSSDFGKVVGFTSAAGGLLALLRIPLHDHFTVNVLHGNYRHACGLMLGVTLFCLLLAVRLFFLKRKNSKAYYKCCDAAPAADARGAPGAAAAADAEQEEDEMAVKDAGWCLPGEEEELCEV